MATLATSQVSFKEILVASDLSKASANAISYAKAIARHFGSHIILAQVSDPENPIAIPEGAWIEEPAKMIEEIEESAKMIEEQVKAAGVGLRAEGFSADAINTYGPVKQEIEALAEAHDADLIVLGTHGRRGLNRFLFGSEAEALMRHSDRPILTVGPAVPAAPEAWVPKNVLCATSLDPRAAKVVAYGYRLAQTVGANFTLLSVEHPDHSSDDEQTRRSFEDALTKAVPEEEVGRHQIRSLLSGKSPAANIVDVARTLKPELIVMGARAAKFGADHLPPGVLAQVLVDVPCPVLTVNTD